MGLVVAAHYVDLDQKVAIKLMFPEHAANPVLAKRFLREAKVAAKVRSPNLVRVTDIGHLESGVPYLVMELLAGNDLDRELATNGPLSVEEAVEHVLQAASGLAELHVLGIVHRDLKPGNLFLSESATGREIKILDYGISKDSAAGTTNLTVTDALIGTPSHMSPEQIKTPKEVDARSDIWSLGVILYELLTYKLPYDVEGSTVGELFGLVLFADPIPLRKRRPELPEGLEAVVMKCLRRDRNERWPTVAALAEALGPYARPESQHRIAAIAKVLAHLPSSPAIPVERPSDPREKATVASGSPKIDKPVDPTALDLAVAPSKSLATSSRALSPSEAQPSRKIPVFALALGGAVVLALGVTFALRSSTPPAPPPGVVASDHPIASEPPPTSASAPAPELVSTAVVVPSATAAPPTSKPTRVVSGAPSAAPKPFIVRTLPTGAAPSHAPATPPPPPKTDELILDRK